MSHDVFISNADEDQATAEAICTALEAKGIACWLNSRDAQIDAESDAANESSVSEMLFDAVDHSRILLIVFSSHANRSACVRRAAERAVERDVQILPFRIEDVPLSKSMEYCISTTHWLNAMTQPVTRHLPYLAQAVEALLSALSKNAGGANAQPDAAAPTRPTWDSAKVRAIEVELSSHLGPLAKLLVRQTLQTAEDEADLCRKLTRHLPADKDKRAFLQHCQTIIGTSLLDTDEPAPAPDAPAAPPDSSPATAAHKGMELNAQALLSAEKQLAQRIGPLAKVLVKKAAREASNLDELYQRLSQHIPSHAERSKFLQSKGERQKEK